MKSFPSTLNEAHNMYGSSKSQSYTNTFDIDRLKSMNLNKSILVIQEMLKEENINISNYNAYPKMSVMNHPDNISSDVLKNNDEHIYFENPLELPADIIALAKDYDWVYENAVKSIVSYGQKSGNSIENIITANTAIAPSMFNPIYGVSVLGITKNTPLLNDTQDNSVDRNTSDCSIRTLCALSKYANNPLGQARYKYADFMYCKDLGKVSNNYLITLRKFPYPIGDHIGELTSPRYTDGPEYYTFKTPGDVGRLVTWFGTDDNKLEDICKYNYHASWKELNSDIQQLESTADDPTTGFVGMMANSFDSRYNKSVAAGQAGTHSMWEWLGSKRLPERLITQGIGKNNGLLYNYDNNKVYTPLNTIQSTHLYEGKLEFSHEFTLNFSYELRAYDNINPRSAFLDLIGNILEVTYRRGKFWGGDRKIIGPQQDMAPFEIANKFVDNAFDKLGGFFHQLQTGKFNMSSILGNIGRGMDYVKQLFSSATDIDVTNKSAGEVAGEVVNKFQNLFESGAIGEGLKGYIKNMLGRPTLYAWNSLLSGDVVGLWHVTIGNPRNPILSIGNLILTDAHITHSGPLGIDDFPTELKLSVTLKHARPRDITEISRMYTQGAASIYYSLGRHDPSDFFGGKNYMTEFMEYKNKKEEQNKKGQTVSYINAQSTNGTGKVEDTSPLEKAYASEIKAMSNNPHSSTYNTGDIGKISDPFLNSDEAVKIARTNNFSNVMLGLSIIEAA